VYDIAYSDSTDDQIAHAFQNAELPFNILGDLQALIGQVYTPLAIRSSSLLDTSTILEFDFRNYLRRSNLCMPQLSLIVPKVTGMQPTIIIPKRKWL